MSELSEQQRKDLVVWLMFGNESIKNNHHPDKVLFDSANDIRLLTDKMISTKTGFEGNLFFDFIGWYQQEYARSVGFAYAWMLFTYIKEFQQAAEIHEFLGTINPTKELKGQTNDRTTKSRVRKV